MADNRVFRTVDRVLFIDSGCATLPTWRTTSISVGTNLRNRDYLSSHSAVRVHEYHESVNNKRSTVRPEFRRIRLPRSNSADSSRGIALAACATTRAEFPERHLQDLSYLRYELYRGLCTSNWSLRYNHGGWATSPRIN